MKTVKLCKKALALFMALVMIIGCVPVMFASAKEVSYSRNCPMIYIHGFMGRTVYVDPNSPEPKDVMPTTDEILACVNGLIPSLTEFMLTRDWQKLGDALVPALCDLLSPCFLNKSGEVDNTSGVRFSYPPASSINNNSELDFAYDWRIDPIESAKQLNDFIDYVLASSGSDKVTISAHSCGGIVALTYISLYGMSKIQGVFFNTTAIFGETYTGELLTGQIILNSDSVSAFLKYIFDYDFEYEELANEIIGMLNNAGLLSFIKLMGDDILRNLSDRLLPEVVFPMLGRCPTVWAMSPDSYMDEAKAYIFDYLLKDEKEEYAKLIEKIDNYGDLVRKSRTETLLQIEENCRLGVLARYGYCSIPITPSWEFMSDGVIDTKYESFGATVANYDKSLGEGYLVTADKKYISPDKNIDASTCLFPEKTWFAKYIKHSWDIGNLHELEKAVLYADEEVTVDTYEKYPQYLIRDDATGDAVPQVEAEAAPTPAKRWTPVITQLLDLIKRLFSYITALFNKGK